MDELFKYFLTTDSIFGILFVALFIFHIRTAKDRENDMRSMLERKIDAQTTDIRLLVELWKTIIKEEVKRRKGDNDV